MKKTIFLLAFVVLCLADTYAQKAKLGFRLGAANSYLYGSDFEPKQGDSLSFGNKWTYTAGFYVNSMVSDYFWIKTEFYFQNKGFIMDSAGTKLKYNYLYIECAPVTPSFHIKGFQLFTGPYAGFAISSNYQGLDANGSKKTYVDTEMDGYNRLDIGLLSGFEYEAPFGLNAGVRFNNSFTSIVDSGSNGGVKTNIFNRQWLITLGYTIGRGDD